MHVASQENAKVSYLFEKCHTNCLNEKISGMEEKVIGVMCFWGFLTTQFTGVTVHEYVHPPETQNQKLIGWSELHLPFHSACVLSTLYVTL